MELVPICNVQHIQLYHSNGPYILFKLYAVTVLIQSHVTLTALWVVEAATSSLANKKRTKKCQGLCLKW